jgi:tryptophan-rich sensory protein
MSNQWYLDIVKPSWAPQPEVFGIVWGILYPIIALAFAFVVWKVAKGEMDRAILWVFLLNLAANLLFTPIQFGLKNLPLAALDILIVLGTTAALVWLSFPRWRWLALALSPYLVWVSIATALQLSITWMNR